MHQHGTNTGTKSKFFSSEKLLCSQGGKPYPKSGAEGSGSGPVSAVLEWDTGLSFEQVESLLFGCQTPDQGCLFSGQ